MAMAVFFKRALVSAMGVLLGSWMLPGIQYVDYQTLVDAVCLLALFSAVLRPLLILLALPFVVLTMGIGLLVINALLYSFVAHLVDGFYVDGFWYAFLGALIITVLNLFFNSWINGAQNRVRVAVSHNGRVEGSLDPKVRKQTFSEKRALRHDDDVIDI
jgi:putative membrane protein